jgi:hypothetical protein
MARFRSGNGLVGPGVAGGVVGAGDWLRLSTADVTMGCETEDGVNAKVMLLVLVFPFDDKDTLWLPA